MHTHSFQHQIFTLLGMFSNTSPSNIAKSRNFQSLKSREFNKTDLLAFLSTAPGPSIYRLHFLYMLLVELPHQWPTLHLIHCYTELLKNPSTGIGTCKDGDSARIADKTAELIKQSYKGMSQFIMGSNKPALRTTNCDEFITHAELRRFIEDFELPIQSTKKRPVVAIALPNGPVLAATCIAVSNYYIASPINPTAGSEQFRADVFQSNANIILTTRGDYENLELSDTWVSERGIQVFVVEWLPGDGMMVRTLAGETPPSSGLKREPNEADDVALILFTSGTSGTKKVVPMTIHSIISGVSFVIESWGLTASDICLNMMPLYHVGGLVRNIFAPILAGGTTVCCSAFDPNLFWDVVEDMQPTWYYASPSMHSVILGEAAVRTKAVQQCRIRLVCNAAGGLLPSLALQLRDTFNCIVLPSYGMTECMPISTPPLSYRLDREGTSGISTGPEIAILDWSDIAVPQGSIGRICVRGGPLFPGYLKPDGTYDKSAFNKDGWFDTGDLGNLDEDGYLYITGRSKEVINRGGELISPFEVEDAIISASSSSNSPISGRVSEALAFSARHDVLQEVVGVVLVTPPGVPRIDLKALHNGVKSSLQQAKWPFIIIYMDDLPRKNNKALRINLSQRLGLPELTDKTPYLESHWEAIVPPPDTEISEPIQSQLCMIDRTKVCNQIEELIPDSYTTYCRQDSRDGRIEVFLAPETDEVKALSAEYIDQVRQKLMLLVDNYTIPSRILAMPRSIERASAGGVNIEALQREIDLMLYSSLENLSSNTERMVAELFAEVLSMLPADIPRDVDFFTLGGDSLRAGRLMSAVRSQFSIGIPIELMFNQGTVMALAAHIGKMAATSKDKNETNNDFEGFSKNYSSTNPLLMLIHLIPLIVLGPLKQSIRLTTFLIAFAYSMELPTYDTVLGRLLNLVVSMRLALLFIQCTAPFVGIAAKWVIIGRYRPGLYPMWGVYHTRWWLVQKITTICGMGIFGLTHSTKNIYLRLMGAKIGKNVQLNHVGFGEWDLLDIGDNTNMNSCICRPFGAEKNATMYLGHIKIGNNCSVGVGSVIAPGTDMPANTCLGHNSSSWEMRDADETYRDMFPNRRKGTHWLLKWFLTTPMMLICWFLSLLPWMAGLIGMVIRKPSVTNSPLRSIIAWFSQADRIGYHYLALSLKYSLSPVVIFIFTVSVRLFLNAVFGELETTSKKASTISIWRANLIAALFPHKRASKLIAMFGSHYEATSVIMRALGAKVGKRVYWPGTALVIGDYHLLEVGNDVVFGSRSHIMTSDGIGFEKVAIGDGAMIADRVRLLPGVEVGNHVTMGSGALTQRNKFYPPRGTYIGSRAGDSICIATGSIVQKRGLFKHVHNSSSETVTITNNSSSARQSHVSTDSVTSLGKGSTNSQPLDEDVSPFGRAFYLNLAPYRVFGLSLIIFYSIFSLIFVSIYWDTSKVSSALIVDHIFRNFLPNHMSVWKDISITFSLLFACMTLISILQVILALALVIASKWALLGRRMPGNYDWDKSSYCQRWKLFLTISHIISDSYLDQGIISMITGTNWIVMYYRAMGANIGKDCALFANGSPSLFFTEPDLITMGDRVTIDDASVVGHINSRGKFDLNRLEIGDRCVLRTGSRLLSGAVMKEGSILLEHTLIMSGDVVEKQHVMQGWPAERFTGSRLGTSV